MDIYIYIYIYIYRCVWVRRVGCIGSWWGNRRERDNRGDVGVDGWIILGWISRRWDVPSHFNWTPPASNLGWLSQNRRITHLNANRALRYRLKHGIPHCLQMLTNSLIHPFTHSFSLSLISSLSPSLSLIHSLIPSPIHSRCHSFTQSLSHSLIHSFIQPLTYIHSLQLTHSPILVPSLIHSRCHSFTQSLSHSLIHSFIQQLTYFHSLQFPHPPIHCTAHSFTHSFTLTNSLVYPLAHSLITSIIHSLIHSSIHSLPHSLTHSHFQGSRLNSEPSLYLGMSEVRFHWPVTLPAIYRDFFKFLRPHIRIYHRKGPWPTTVSFHPAHHPSPPYLSQLLTLNRHQPQRYSNQEHNKRHSIWSWKRIVTQPSHVTSPGADHRWLEAAVRAGSHFDLALQHRTGGSFSRDVMPSLCVECQSAERSTLAHSRLTTDGQTDDIK